MSRPYVPDNHDLPDEHDEVGDFDNDPIAWVGIVFIGVLLGVPLSIFVIAKLVGVI